MDGTGWDSSPNLARLVAFPVKHFLNYVQLHVMCPVPHTSAPLMAVNTSCLGLRRPIGKDRVRRILARHCRGGQEFNGYHIYGDPFKEQRYSS